MRHTIFFTWCRRLYKTERSAWICGGHDEELTSVEPVRGMERIMWKERSKLRSCMHKRECKCTKRREERKTKCIREERRSEVFSLTDSVEIMNENVKNTVLHGSLAAISASALESY